jgi:hypothetical protein
VIRRPDALAGLLAAIVIPGLAAGGAVLVLAGNHESSGRSDGSAAELARKAEAPRTLGPRATDTLRPILARRGHSGVQDIPLEGIEGGVRPAPPQRISIPEADVETVIDPVGTRKGEIEVPPLGRAGWFEGGPRPGESGRAVLIGHLDTKRGPGLFARVPQVRVGAGIRITDRRGEVYSYEVVGRAQVRKDRFPTAEVYGSASSPVLVLVTCGGPYTEGRGYRDNVLLYARAA